MCQGGDCYCSIAILYMYIRESMRWFCGDSRSMFFKSLIKIKIKKTECRKGMSIIKDWHR